VITRSDVLSALEEEPSGTRTVLDASSRDVVVAYPDETLSDASAKMLSRNIGRLPVVDRADSRKIFGYLGRQAIMAGRLRRFEEEHVRERGWIDGWRGGKGNQSLRPA
jgi:CIC family chloride channel protein